MIAAQLNLSTGTENTLPGQAISAMQNSRDKPCSVGQSSRASNRSVC